MMANWNFNYIYDIPPNEGYQEFGDEPNEAPAVPFVHAPIIYNVQYTGVSSFEYNGATYYNYNVYEAPVLSFYDYSGHDYSVEVNTDDYSTNVVTEYGYDYSVEVSTGNYNADVVTEDGYDYSVEVYADSFNSNIVTEDGYDYYAEGNAEYYNSNVVTEDGYDYLMEVSTDNYNADVVTKDGYDYSVEVYACSYSSNIVTEDDYDYSVEGNTDNYNANVDSEEGSNNNEYQQRSITYDTVSSHISTDSSPSISYDSIYSDSFSTDISWNKSLNNTRSVDNKNCSLETNVTSTEKLSSYISFSISNESPEINSQNNACPNIEVDDNFTAMRNKGTDAIDYDIKTSGINTNINTSAINTDAESDNCNESNVLEHFTDIRKNNLYEDSEVQSFVYEENKISDWSIEVEDNVESDNCNESNVLEHFMDVRKNNLYEDSEEQSFVYEENRILDWSIEVEDNDTKEEEDDSFKVNFSPSDDIETYNSKEVIKYLKENLYLYALSGHMSLKESIPVVDILPTIDEEPESVEEDYSLKGAVADLEQKEEIIQSVIEKKEVADLSADKSHPFIECHALEYTVEDSEQVTKSNPELAENNLSSTEALYTIQQNRSISEYQATQSDKMVNNDDKLPNKDTKLINFNADCTSLASGEELQVSVENVLNHVETNNAFMSALKSPQMHNDEKGYQSKLQNNCIKIVEGIGATQIKSLCPESDAPLKTSEEVEIRKEVISNQFGSNRITNTTCHVPQEMETRVEYYSERNVEKVVEVDEKVLSKGKKKKFHTLRKWLGNLCCCARKST